MVMKSKLRASLYAACLMLAVASGTARAQQEVQVVTGDTWSKSTEQMKKAYLIGMANVYQVEAAYQAKGPTPVTDAQSLVPRTTKGLRGQTLDSVRVALDKWYAANPDKLQRPVIETMWFEIILPATK